MSDEAKSRSGFRFQKDISVGNLLTLLVVAVAAVVGYVRVEALAMQAAAGVLENAKIATENREFHVKQRVRLWDRVNIIHDNGNQARADLSAVSAKTDYIAHQVDRLVQNLIARKASR